MIATGNHYYFNSLRGAPLVRNDSSSIWALCYFETAPVPMTEKEAQAERFVGIDDRQIKEDMLCLRHDPDIKGQAPA